LLGLREWVSLGGVVVVFFIIGCGQEAAVSQVSIALGVVDFYVIALQAANVRDADDLGVGVCQPRGQHYYVQRRADLLEQI
ncbi:hypothetical protein AAHH78_37845, partial [Burkholderia pseudomallei]